MRSGRETRRFLAFVLAAGASVPVNLAARVLASQRVSYGLAIVIAHGAGMVTAWALSRRFVFERSQRPVHDELGRFALVNVLSLAVTWSVALLLVEGLFPRVGFTLQPEFVGHVAGLATSAVTSFFAHRAFSFRPRGG
ncbi:GtrA family protein [Aquabacterium sp. J223]|uniref:GtrA family protein n=1 Tax=Aquabacterium sp. J223 TaxID=2898431 RepID=UPI0021AD6730|nr:GtrA family protein [Aquabacterium sp. J223]UUX94085.1 GtrA family protein [Aquabacterium sp. J223]